MGGSEPDQSTGVWPGLLGVGALALAVGCCAGLPLAVALAGSVAVGALVGVAAGAVILIALVGLIVILARRRSSDRKP